MWKKIFIFSIIAVLLAWVFRKPPLKEAGDVVETKYGSIRGVISKSRGGREFQGWFGIPYAKPPLGELRFASPVRPEKWQGIRDGSFYRAKCAQITSLALISTPYIGEEDCLHLNVFAPKTTNNPRLPVMVFIHGGGFVFGSADQYGPEYFMDEDVILVTINYRLTLFGFLNSGDKSIRGNMGLKDQVLALKWVKENIENFGGDPNEVTIFGESAGGASTHSLLLSPSTKGLFKKVISQSGVASVPWGHQDLASAKRYTSEFAQDLDCPTKNTQEMVKCLRTKSKEELLEASRKEVDNNFVQHPERSGHFLGPTTEAVNDDEAFLTENPLEVVKKGKQQRVPWMAGVNSDEGLLATAEFYKSEDTMISYEKNWDNQVLISFGIPLDAPNAKEISSQLKELYFPKKDSARLTHQQKLDAYTKLFSDAFFIHHASITFGLQKNYSPVYLYYLNRQNGPTFNDFFAGLVEKFNPIIDVTIYIAKMTFYKLLGLRPYNMGTCHADDLPLLFVYEDVFNVKKDESSADYKFSRDMVKLWVQFARDENAMEFRGVKWAPQKSNSNNLRYLELNESPKIVDEPFLQRTIALTKILKLV